MATASDVARASWTSRIRRELRANVLLPWVSLFLILSVFPVQDGGPGAFSRYAAMRSMARNGSWRIDELRGWSVDWARAPDGHYYSNKAPGMALLGLPIFFVLDAFVPASDAAKPPGPVEMILFCLLAQLLPFAIVVLWIGRSMQRDGVPDNAILFFGLAALFGNTAAIYMGCYLGNSMAAIFLLEVFRRWLRADFFAAACLLGVAFLCDYGAACFFPFFILGTWRRAPGRARLAQALAGLGFSLLISFWYHWSVFGNPFVMATFYSNPLVLDKFEGSNSLLGKFLSVVVLFELLFGTARGLLFTQPWAFVSFAALAPGASRLPRGTTLFLGGGFAALLFLVSNTASWDGGWVIGPRYLAIALPALAMALALRWQAGERVLQAWCWLGLAPALLFRLLVQPFTNTPWAFDNLWTYFAGRLLAASPGEWGIYLWTLGAAAAAWIWYYRLTGKGQVK